MESQQRLRDELHSHASLVHSLRVVDANSSIQMLSRLRHGEFDSALLGTDLPTRTNSSGDRIYPWEEHVDDKQRQRTQDAEGLPPIEAFPPVRHEGALYPLPRSTIEQPGLPYERAASSSSQVYSASFAAGPHAIHAPQVPMEAGSVPAYYQRMPTFQHPEMPAQVRRSSSFQQQGDISHISSVPSNDPNRAYPGPS